MIRILQVVSAIDAHVIPYPAILIYDSIADITAMSNAHGRQPMLPGQLYLFDGFIKVYPHQVTADNRCSRTDAGADADDAVLDAGSIDDTAFCNNSFFQRSTADLGRRQHPRTGVNSFLVVE